MSKTETELVRNVLAVLFLAILTASSYYILQPFLAAIIWAVTIAVATWPQVLWLERKFGGRRGPAAMLMTLVGTRGAEQWDAFASAGTGGLAAQPARWFLGKVGSVGATIVQLLLTVILAATLFPHGEGFARAVRRFARRVGGDAGERAVDLARAAIRGVALGVVVTAVVQTTLSGLGLFIAGVPYAGILTAIILILCIAQIGPMLVLIPVVIWGFSHLGVGWGAFLLVWSLVAGTLDNWLRPILIRRGVDLPLLLIFTGVIGGLMAFGLIGIFVGPVALAMAYTLFGAWVEGGEAGKPAGVPVQAP